MPVPTAQIDGIGKPVSRLVLGTMIVNRREKEKSFELLDAALECGLNTLDCAHVYAGGDSERAIGAWMEERGNREKIVVISKGAHPNEDRKRVTPFDIEADLHDSLARLKCDYIDLYFLHRDDVEVPVGPIVECLNEQKAAGRIRAFGGSNWTHERIQAAREYAQKKGLQPFTVSSPHFSLGVQVENPWGPGCVTATGDAEAAARAWYASTHLPLFAYSSLCRGLFSGRITRDNFEAVADGACQTAYCHEENFKRLDRARELAERRGVTIPQIATAYVLNFPLNLFALIGAANRDEIQANVEAVELKLSEQEIKWLNLE